MAELNFGLLNPPGSQSIGNAFVTGMDQGQEARARDLQMQQSVRQGQMAELQFKKAQDAEAKLNQFYAHVADNGGPKDPVAIEDQMIGSGIPSVANTGLSARMARLKIEQDRKLYAAANTPGAPAAAPAPTGGVANMLPGVVQPVPTGGVTNMLLGAAPSAPVVPPQVRSQMDALNARIDANLALGTDQGNKTADVLQKQADNLSRRYTVGNTLMSGAGGVVGTAPEATSQEIRTMQALGYPNTQAGYISFRDAQRQERLLTPDEEAQQIRMRSASRPSTTLNIDTKVGNKYGETFAKDIGEADAKLRLAALDAPTMAANANQTLKLLEDPKIFTGGAANVKLNIARALNVIGDTDTTSIANTESLVQSTGNATLAAIKGSGLGTGQGFTDKDLKMLQGVAGGTIELNADTLRAFANAQHNAATAMVKKWESRRANIPPAALSGTGIDKETYSVEPKFSAYVEVKTTADGRKLGKKADGTVEVIK